MGLGFILPMVNYLKGRGVKLVENCLITKLLKVDGKVVGAVGLQEEPVVFKAKAVILATGGSGGLYTRTDVPLNMTGDGYALAYDVGAVLRDMEFVQFLPVGLAEPDQPLIPVYGPVVEEGRIINVDGEDLVKKHNITARPLALMSRDLLSRALMREVAAVKRLLEAEMAIMASLLTAKAALAREESRGTHFRLNYPESSDEWLRPLLVKKTGDGPEVSL